METLGDRVGATGSLSRLLRYLPLLALGNLFIAAPALIISGAVAYFAFEQAEATKKMQAGSVWPNITYDTSNLSEAGEPRISFDVSNRGVGPAKIKGMQISLDGQPYRTIQDLLRDCCLEKGDPLAVVLTGVNGEVIPAGEEVSFAAIRPDNIPAAGYERLGEAHLRVRAQICFCSVFDECWIEDSQSTTVQPTAQCPADWMQYGFPSGVAPGR